MPELITKKELLDLNNFKGMVRGQAPKNVGEFVLDRGGKEELKKLEDAMAALGYPIKYETIKNMDFYPLGFLLVTYLACQKLFNYDDETFRKIGEFQSKSSFIISLFTRYLFSLGAAINAAPKMWRKYFSEGNLMVIKMDESERVGIIRLKNFRTHPLHCLALCGYFASIVNILVSGTPRAEEIKCPSRGDKYHEFSVKW